MTQRPNILFLSVDALRADRSSAYGYERPTTPTLERLARGGTRLDNSFSLSSVTQTALIQMLTSSRPFSYGGYDYGAVGRPTHLFKHVRTAGYKTICLSSLHWVNRFFGYGDGVDQEHQLFDVVTLPGVTLAMIRATLLSYEAGEIDDAALIAEVDSVMRHLFSNLRVYCDIRNANADELRRDFADSSLVNSGYDLEAILAITERHRIAYEKDPIGYIRKYLIPAPGPNTWMQRWLPKEWYLARKKSVLLREAVSRSANWVLAHFNPRLAQCRNRRFKVYPDARSLADKVIERMRAATDGDAQPFMIWTHFMDTHLPYIAGGGRRWYTETPRYLEALGYDPKIPPALTFDGTPKSPDDGPGWSALYDAAVRSTDEEIGRIVDACEEMGLLDNTIIVVTGDHGEEIGERGAWGHFFRLYEWGVHVPTVIHGPGVAAGTVKGLTNIMDIAPTVSRLAGLEPDAAWDGFDVLADDFKGRDNIMIETFYSGNCLFAQRPLYFALRNDRFHYLWKEYIDRDDVTGEPQFQLFDIVEDPKSERDIYRDDHPAVLAFNREIAARMREINEVNDTRIATAFDDGFRNRGAAS